ncbi:hypothetical protein LINPERHAP2_LOCUS33446, partial [Linum perenne]
MKIPTVRTKPQVSSTLAPSLRTNQRCDLPGSSLERTALLQNGNFQQLPLFSFFVSSSHKI